MFPFQSFSFEEFVRRFHSVSTWDSLFHSLEHPHSSKANPTHTLSPLATTLITTHHHTATPAPLTGAPPPPSHSRKLSHTFAPVTAFTLSRFPAYSHATTTTTTAPARAPLPPHTAAPAPTTTTTALPFFLWVPAYHRLRVLQVPDFCNPFYSVVIQCVCVCVCVCVCLCVCRSYKSVCVALPSRPPLNAAPPSYGPPPLRRCQRRL